MSYRRRCAALAAAAVVAGSAVALLPAFPAAAAPVNGTYHAVTPTRVLDTRTGTGAPKAPVAGGHSIALSLGSVGHLPAAGSFSAAVLNVTVTDAQANSAVVVYPDGAALPYASNLNVTKGATVANLVITRVPADGIVRLYNYSQAPVDLIADVSGYFTGSDAPSGQGTFGALSAPRRLVDTRYGTGVPKAAVASHATLTFTVTGAGVPADASAAVLNVTVVSPTATGDLRVFPAGASVPFTSNLNFVRGQVVPVLVAARIGTSGQVSIYNDSPGTVQIVADISGYFEAGDPLQAGAFGPLTPVRLLDTRYGTGAPKHAVAGLGTVSFTVTGLGGVPKAGVAAVFLSVTSVGASSGGYLTVYAAGAPQPAVSNLDFGTDQVVPNLVLTAVGTQGRVTVYNGSHAAVNVIADVAGYVLASDVTNSGHGIPPVSVSRYIRNLTGAASTDKSTLHSEGCADATGGSTLVLLDIGAQSISGSPASDPGFDTLDASHPGVLLTGGGYKRLTYPHLVADLQAYIDGFNGCASADAIVAIDTNNDGDFATYTATQKGTDWGTDVVLALSGGTHVAVVGAIDIEAEFASTPAQASQWESAYLSATAATNGLLIDNGALENCPTTYDSTAECGPVAGQAAPWTRADYVALLNGNAPTRIVALPQVYSSALAVQWANIDDSAAGAIAFIGSLTQFGVGCGAGCSMTPLEGFAALYHAISTVVTAPDIPDVTDLISS